MCQQTSATQNTAFFLRPVYSTLSSHQVMSIQFMTVWADTFSRTGFDLFFDLPCRGDIFSGSVYVCRVGGPLSPPNPTPPSKKKENPEIISLWQTENFADKVLSSQKFYLIMNLTDYGRQFQHTNCSIAWIIILMVCVGVYMYCCKYHWSTFFHRYDFWICVCHRCK